MRFVNILVCEPAGGQREPIKTTNESPGSPRGTSFDRSELLLAPPERVQTRGESETRGVTVGSRGGFDAHGTTGRREIAPRRNPIHLTEKKPAREERMGCRDVWETSGIDDVPNLLSRYTTTSGGKREVEETVASGGLSRQRVSFQKPPAVLVESGAQALALITSWAERCEGQLNGQTAWAISRILARRSPWSRRESVLAKIPCGSHRQHQKVRRIHVKRGS